MNLNDRISAFARLGEILRDSLAGKPGRYSEELNNVFDTQYLKNPWFTPGNVRKAAGEIAGQLTMQNLVQWTSKYPESGFAGKPLNVGVIMAGNIPLVGFHDFLCVLISGNNVIAKTSSKDPDLIRKLAVVLCEIEPGFRNRIVFTDGLISGFDAVIATGSDNSSRYFEFYFGKYPNIIRKNRNSVAILDGTEKMEDLEVLGDDVFSYFGLGCRNISKIFVPKDYDLNRLAGAWQKFAGLTDHSKYGNNYDYHKALFLVNRERFLDTGFLLLKEDFSFSSPVAVVYYQIFSSEAELRSELGKNTDRIQCITGHGYLPFGKAQSPFLWDYADGIDTLEFLLKKNIAGIL